MTVINGKGVGKEIYDNRIMRLNERRGRCMIMKIYSPGTCAAHVLVIGVFFYQRKKYIYIIYHYIGESTYRPKLFQRYVQFKYTKNHINQ